MRLEARVLEGDEQITELVPLRSLVTFKADTKHGVDWWINQARDPESDVEFTDWEPRLAHQTMVDRNGEERDFATWLTGVEWCGIYTAADELDPSGGEETRTTESSPASSSDPAAPGQSSSGSTTTSKRRSGRKSTAG